MKKKICASVMVALVLVAALATFASAAALIEINGPVTVQQGETVTLRVEVSGVEGITADVEATGMEIVSFSGGLSDATSLLLLEDYGGMTATYTYRVTAGPGQTATFTLRNVIESQDMVDSNGPDQGWQATVASGDQPSESPTPSPSQEPSAAPSPSDTPSTAPSASAQPSDQQSPAPASSAPAASESAQGGQQSQAPSPTIGASTPVASSSQGGAAIVTVTPGSGGTTGGTTTVRLPKTADSTTNMWLFATLTAAVGTIAIIAAKKCAIGKKEAHDEQ